MSGYKKLVSSIQGDVTVLGIDLYNRTGYYGLYRNDKIYTGKTLSTRQKKNISIEEYRHHQTPVSAILSQNCTENREQESKAHNMALEQLVTLDDLVRCSEVGLSNHYSCAEFLEIDVETLKNVITYYRQKYGATHLYKERIFEFRDYFMVVLNTGLT